MKKLIFTLLMCCLGTGMVNAQCTNIFTQFNGSSSFWQINFAGQPLFSGTTCNAQFSYTVNPGVFRSGDLINFNVNAGAIYLWQTCGLAGWDTYIRIWNGGTLAFITSNDDFCGLQSRLVWPATFSGQIWLGVTHFVCSIAPQTDTYGLLSYCIPPAPPANDDVCNAIPLGVPTAVGTTSSFSSLFASVEAGEPSPGAGTGAFGSCESLDGWCSFETALQNTVWFTFIAPASGNVDIATGPFDTQVAVWLIDDCEDLGSATEVYANDDSGPIFASLISDGCGAVSYIPGQEYFVQIDGFAGTAGNNGSITITEVPAGAPTANDGPCAAVAIAVGGCGDYDNECATADAGEVSPGAGTGNSSCDSQDGWCAFETGIDNSQWYSFVAPASGCVSISTTPNDGFDDMQLAVYSAGNCGDYTSFSELAANDDGGNTLFAPFIDQLSCLTPGATYYVQLDGFGGTIGAGDICISDCGNDPLSCDAGPCQQRLLGYGGLEDQVSVFTGSGAGGFPPYTYSWSGPGIVSQNGALGCVVVQPMTAGTHVYTLTVTDSHGCTTECTTTLNTIDLTACHPNGHKVQVCHVPPGNPANEHNICIGAPAVAAHIVGGGHGHGTCYLGPCGDVCRLNNNNDAASCPEPPACVDVTVVIRTDIFGSETSWELVGNNSGQVMSGGVLFGNFLSGSTTFTVTECLDPTDCYTFTIYDSYGDGVCCTFGVGFYNVTFDGVSTGNIGWGGATGTGVGGNGTNGFVGLVSSSSSFGNCTPKAGDPTVASAASAIDNIMVKAYPNPFSSVSNIEFMLDSDATAKVEIFNLTGVKIAEIFNGAVKANQVNTANFNAGEVADGIYIYKITTNTGMIESGKIYKIK